MYPQNHGTCWADDAYQKCPKNRQGAYDLVLATSTSDMDAAYCVHQALITQGTFQGVECKEQTTAPPATADADVTEQVSCTGGSWKSEVSWDLTCDDGTNLSGGAPYDKSMTLAQGAKCDLAMNDSFGDGWNGNKWKGFGANCTIARGRTNSCSFTVPAPPGPPPKVSTDISCGGGRWKKEVSWTLNCGGNTTLSGGAPF